MSSIKDTIPTNYNPYLHIIFPALVASLIIIACLTFLQPLTFLQLSSLPITLFLLFGFEWVAHKYILHRPQPGMRVIHHRHIIHHQLYTDQQMAMQGIEELWYILMPPYAILMIVLFLVPLELLIGLLFGTNVALLVLMLSMVFFITYEFLHFSYHSPKNSWLAHNVIISKLRTLHQIHHNPDNMKKYNFNVSLPVFDLILRTYRSKKDGI